MSDIVERLRAWHAPGETITGDIQLYLEAAEIIEQYRADQKSDEQTNNELRALRDTLVQALAKISHLVLTNRTHSVLDKVQRVCDEVLDHVGSPGERT